MNCKVCGSFEFCTESGITYCTECQTQIEKTQTEEAVEYVISRDISSPAPKKTHSIKQKEYGDWITAECFNHIIFMQVSALIKLGASPNLKKTVLHIWSKYLQKCEIAFRIDYQAKDDKRPHLGPLPLKRDVKVLYENKQISSRKRKISEKSQDSVSAISGEESNISESNITDTDNSSDVDSILPEKSREKKRFSLHAKKFLKKSRVKRANKGKFGKEVFSLTLQKTLGICYLGLLYTEDQFSLLDLIRFAYEEKIPYINIIDKLPSSLKLQDRDIAAFLVYAVPDAFTLLKLSRDIAHFLNLPRFKEPSVFVAVSRFVKDLNLPDEIKPIVKTLMDKYKEVEVEKYKEGNWVKASKLKNLPHDYQALVFIILALKMLFVIDDQFEMEHSRTINKLNTIHNDRKFFEWEDWKKQSVLKEYLFLCEKPGYCTINRLDILNADKIISKYPFTRLKPENLLSGKKDDDSHLRNNIMNLLSDLVSIPSFSGSVATSFPLRSAASTFIEQWKTLPMFHETQEIDFSLLKKDFSSCSLSFNPLRFDKIDNELSYLLMTSLYEPETSVHLGRKFSKPITYHEQTIRTASNYWFFNPQTSRKTVAPDWLEVAPDSFKWLINFISKYAYCNNTILYKEVVKIEKLMFLQRRMVKKFPKYCNKTNLEL